MQLQIVLLCHTARPYALPLHAGHYHHLLSVPIKRSCRCLCTQSPWWNTCSHGHSFSAHCTSTTPPVYTVYDHHTSTATHTQMSLSLSVHSVGRKKKNVQSQILHPCHTARSYTLPLHAGHYHHLLSVIDHHTSTATSLSLSVHSVGRKERAVTDSPPLPHSPFIHTPTPCSTLPSPTASPYQTLLLSASTVSVVENVQPRAFLLCHTARQPHLHSIQCMTIMYVRQVTSRRLCYCLCVLSVCGRTPAVIDINSLPHSAFRRTATLCSVMPSTIRPPCRCLCSQYLGLDTRNHRHSTFNHTSTLHSVFNHASTPCSVSPPSSARPHQTSLSLSVYTVSVVEHVQS